MVYTRAAQCNAVDERFAKGVLYLPFLAVKGIPYASDALVQTLDWLRDLLQSVTTCIS